MDLSIFKGYDIRGVYPDQINEELAYAVGRAVVRMLSAKTVVVGRDMRTSSPSLAAKLIEGITCEGADVIDLELCTTPMVSFAVANYGYDAGIMVSASHNPEKYNAFKIVKPGILQVDKDGGLMELKEIVSKGFASCSGKGAVVKKEILPDYLGHILKFAEDISDLKIVVDYGNGVGSVSAKPAYTRLDIDLVEMNAEPDGSFPNHPANPHDIENFKDLQKRVETEKADLGIFYDGDADRALFVDENSKVAPIDLIVALLAKEELARDFDNKAVYYDLRFSKAVANIVKNAGGKPEMMAVGNPIYKKALKEKGGILGAEFSGHVMFSENFGIDDGLFVTIKLMSLLSKEGKPLSELISSVKKYEGSEEISLTAQNADTVFDRIISEFPNGKLIELDGIYLDFEDGFISVRQSQTEPLFRVRAEAKTKEELKKRLDKVIEIIKS